jgi:hypothetical protein
MIGMRVTQILIHSVLNCCKIPQFTQNGPNMDSERYGLVATVDRKRLLKLCVLGFGLLQDGDVGVGVFPEVKKVFVGG